MRTIFLLLLASCCFASCSKNSNTSYSGPPPAATSKRLIKFAYEGSVYGVLPVYEGLADTPKHRFEATGITESQFVKTKAGDTIRIIIALSSEGTKPLPAAVEDNADAKPVPQTVTQMPSPDASSRFMIVVK